MGPATKAVLLGTLQANQVAVGIHSALDVQFLLLGRGGHLGDGLALVIVQQVDLGGRIPCVQAGQNLSQRAAAQYLLEVGCPEQSCHMVLEAANSEVVLLDAPKRCKSGRYL